MRLRIKRVNLNTGGPLIAVLSSEDATRLNIYAEERIMIKRLRSKEWVVAVADVGFSGISPGQIGLFGETFDRLGADDGAAVDVQFAKLPESLNFVRAKLDGAKLTKGQIDAIVSDIVGNKLSAIELTYFVAGCYTKGMDIYESAYLTDAIVRTGRKLKFNSKMVLDKHCLSADTPVIFKNSGQTKVKGAGEIIDKIFERSKDVRVEDGAEFTSEGLNNLHLLTFDDEGTTSYKPVSGVFRAKSPAYLYRIVLKGNREIKVTSDHTVFVLKGGKIVNIPSKNLEVGDHVIVPGKLNLLNDIKEIDFKADFDKRNYHPFPAKVKITAEFVRFLAYYIAEGFTNYQGVFLNFGSHEHTLVDDSLKCIKSVFGFNATLTRPHKTAVRVCIHNQYFAKTFGECINAGSNALCKRIPSFVFDISEELRMEFLRALIKGDGHVRRGYEAQYGTSSKELAGQLQYFLSLLGLSVSVHKIKPTKRKFRTQVSSISPHYCIYTQARNIYGGRIKANVAFNNLLPIRELGKLDTAFFDYEARRSIKRQRYVTKGMLNRHFDCIESEDVRKLVRKDLSVLPVKSVERVVSDSEYVYDFRVPGYNKFMAGTAPICVHNCTGGIPGNRTTMVVVPIVAAAGFLMPKTSSRAITSAAGTADVMEVFAPVNLTAEKIKRVIKKAKACIAWGGAMHLAGADESMIRVRHPLSIDPTGMMLASILAKKRAVGATHVLIDVPYGANAKFATRQEADKIKRKFEKVAELIGLKVNVVLTDGSQPVGNGIGPALEARDVLGVLHGDGPKDLIDKSVMLATELLRMAGVANPKERVLEILESGKAFRKFRDIVVAQGGSKALHVPRAKNFHVVFSKRAGTVCGMHNRHLARLARVAGAPSDKTAGIYLCVKKGSKVKKGDRLFTVHSQSKDKLGNAVALSDDPGLILME